MKLTATSNQLDDPETILLIDQWQDQPALDRHHQSPMMAQLAQLREKYDLHLQVQRFTPISSNPADERYLRK